MMKYLPLLGSSFVDLAKCNFAGKCISKLEDVQCLAQGPQSSQRERGRGKAGKVRGPLTSSALFGLALALAALVSGTALAAETVQRIYSAPDPAANGGIHGSVNLVLTDAIAVAHDRVHVYRGLLSDANKTFRFDGLPTGKYDLVLLTKDGVTYEGLALGEEKKDLPHGSLENLKKRVEAQDAFFNRALIQRYGFDGDNALVFVERIRDKQILKQDATTLNATLRRLEVIEMAQAGDDWQVTVNRHLYREEQPPGGINYLKHGYVVELGNLRIVDTVKDLGGVKLSPL